MTEHRPLDPPASTTIATIASEVGVSVATVSKVLNGRADVAPETRARVEASLDRHRYRRREPRRRPRDGQVDLVFHEFDSAWAMEIIRGVEAVPPRPGSRSSSPSSAARHRPPARLAGRLLVDRQPLGVLFVHVQPDRGAAGAAAAGSGIPFVVVDTDSATSASVPTVGSNNWNGGLLAARHLLELGHRRIAIISGPQDLLCSRARPAGFQLRARRGRASRSTPSWSGYGNFYRRRRLRARAWSCCSPPDPPTAIFAGSDIQAHGRAAGRPPARPATCPGTCRWSGTTTCRSPPGSTRPHHRPPAAARHGRHRHPHAARPRVRGDVPATSRDRPGTELVVRESTAPARRARTDPGPCEDPCSAAPTFSPSVDLRAVRRPRSPSPTTSTRSGRHPRPARTPRRRSSTSARGPPGCALRRHLGRHLRRLRR